MYDYLNRENSVIHLVSEFIADLECSENEDKFNSTEDLDITHDLTYENIIRFKSYLPATQHSLRNEIANQILALRVISAFTPNTMTKEASNDELFFPPGDWG